jgi:hypothetical protein
MKKNKGKRLGVFNTGLTNRQKRRLEDKKVEKMIMVCETNNIECDNKDFRQTVGNVDHLFCCEKGFLITLEDFKKTIS